MIANIPNILTVSRLFFLPCFLLMLFFDSASARIIFVSIAIILSITDFFDGYLARKFNIHSKFGRIFDPIADKIFILVISIMLLVTKKFILELIIVPIIIILIRELVVSGIRENLAQDNIVIKVSFLAKYKTAFQMLAVCFLILGGQENFFLLVIEKIGIALLYISTLLTILTFINYLKQSYNNIIK